MSAEVVERAGEDPSSGLVHLMTHTHTYTHILLNREVLAKMKQIEANVKMAKKKGKDPLESMELNFRFVGAPGTGEKVSHCGGDSSGALVVL